MKRITTFRISHYIVVMVMILLFPRLSMSQSTANYTCDLTNITGSLTDMSTGTTDLLATGVYRSNAASAVANIGFTFYFMSTPFTQFSINSNGQMKLGGVAIGGAAQSPLPSTALLAPMSGANSIQTTGKVHYKVTGPLLNQVLTVEWLDLRIPASNTAGTLSRMQVLLYEATGKIEYVYGSMYNNLSAQTRSVFLSSSNVANTIGWIGTFNVTPTYNTSAVITATTLVNNAVIANLNSTADGSRRVFSFTPPAGPVSAAPTWAATPITNPTTAGMILNWNDNSSNESGFQIYRSTDNITFTLVASTAANATTFIATGLTSSTLYYWKVAAFSEGSASLYTTVSSLSTTATSTFTSITSGNWSSGSTWSTGSVPAATDDVIINNPHTVTIDAPGLAAKSLTVNGSLTYHATTVSALTVNGNVTVNATGSFTSPSSGTVITHSLNIGGSTATGTGGNLVVDGIFNMNAFSTAGVAVSFYGTSNNTISGIGSTINFYSIRVNKGSGNYNSILDVPNIITCADANSTTVLRLDIQMGTFKLSSASSFKPFYGGVQPTQANNARLWLNNASANIEGVGAGTAAGPAGTLNFGGLLQIDAGTLSYGNGNSSISIFGNFQMSGANSTLNVYGYFYSGNASTYTITGGNINIYPQLGANYVAPIYFSQMGLFHFGGTTLNFTGGTLTIADANLAVTAGSSYAPYSINISGGTNNLAGSTIRFGDGVSDLEGSVNGFTINSGTALGNVIVNNNPSSIKTTRYVKILGNLTIGGNLTINSGAANQFFVNGFMLTSRGNITNSGTLTFDVAAPGNVTSGLTFTGSTQQTVGGTGTFSTNVNNLIITNTSAASPAVDLQIPLSVSNSLTLTRGILGSSNSSVLTIGKAGYTTFNLTRSGGSLASAPAFTLGGVTTLNVTYSAPSPAASIITNFELPAATPITTFTVSNISGVTLDKPVGCTTLALTSGILTTNGTNTITVTGTAAASITGGSATAYVNGPLTRTLPNNAAAANYRFPVGKTAYQLFEYSSITTGGTGTATFTAEAFDAGPYAGTAGTGLSSVNTNKYWSLTASLGSVSITSSAVRLTDAGLGAINRIGQSNTATGTYNSVGGTVAGTTITSVNPIDYSALAAGTYFRVGTVTAFAAGLYAIGPQASYAGYSATFASMTAAVAAITSVPLPGHVIFEFQTDYSPSVEPATVTMTSLIVSNVSSTVTFRPAAGVTSVINISKAVSIINNTGADYITFDGRNGGSGTNRFLQFTNTTAAGATVSLSADAQYNKILYCTLKGGTATASTGILTISGGTAGNNFYTVDNSVFDASGSANNCIYTSGIATDATITNNNFFDYRNGAGINLAGGSDNSVIDNNNFYQTTAYNGFAGTTYGIYVASGNNCRISNNNIGGSGPGITGTWTVSATTPAAYNFTGIFASLGTTSKIYNNKIQNFDWKSAPAIWTGINGSGTVNIGVDGANFVGSSTGNDNIKITYYNTIAAATVNGMVIGGTSVTVSNNNIGSITTLLSGATGIGSSIYGIATSATTAVISNNTIGSATTPQSINAANQSTTGSVQNVYGINITSNGTLTISGNTIANLYSGMTFASATVGLLRGIKGPGAGGGNISITSNNIYSISTPQSMTGAISGGSSYHSIAGIDLNSTNSSGTSLAGNNIYNLVNTAATGAVSVLGIYCQSGSNTVFDKNYIHSFTTASSTAVQTGINLNYGGPCTIKNNVIRLGHDLAGNSITTNAQINGIIKNSGNGFPCYAYFNSVYINGTGVTAGPAATYCFNVTLHVTEDIRDNNFVNTRSGGGTNYAIRVAATGVAPSGLTMNYNDYYVNGTGTMLGYYNGNVPDLAGWKAAVGLDASSISADPQFISETYLKPLNPALAAGTAIAGIATDFEGTPRSATSPTNGAYEYAIATVITTNNPTITYGTLSVNLTATVTPNPGGGSVQFFINGSPVGSASVDAGTGIATFSYNTSALVVGSYVIRADFGGFGTFAASTTNPSFNGTLSVIQANQTITFNALPDKTFGDPPFNLTATASSGLAVSYMSSNPNVATIVGNTVTIVGSGTTNITASQAGDASYNPAPDVVQPLNVNSVLNLTLFFEGLYVGGGTMNQAWNATDPQFAPGIADVVSIDLHDAVTFATVHYTVNNIPVSTSGNATIAIPPIYNGSYYISVHQRNSIETITGSPLNLGGNSVNYDFSTSASQTFGNNVKQMPDGKWALYGGDANGDGGIDGNDLIGVENDAFNASTGYILTDVNGDGGVDGFDLILVENNAFYAISVITP